MSETCIRCEQQCSASYRIEVDNVRRYLCESCATYVGSQIRMELFARGCVVSTINNQETSDE